MEKSNEKGLWAIMKPIKTYIAIAIVLAALGAITSITGMVLLAFVLEGIGDSVGILGFDLSFNTALIVLLVVIVASFLFTQQAFIVSHLGAFKLEKILRTQMTEHLANIPLGHIISTGTGALKKTLLDDVKVLHAFVADSTPTIGKAFAAPAASLIALIIIDYRLAIVALIVLIVGAGLMHFVMKDSVVHREAYDKNQADINSSVVEFVQAMPVVRTFDDGTSSFRRYSNALERYRVALKAWIAETAVPAKISMTILSPMPTLLAISMVGIYLVVQNELNLYVFIAALMVSTGMADALMPLMWLSNFIKKSQAGALRIQELMDIPELQYSCDFKNPTNKNIVLNNVSFQYEETHDYALTNVSFEVREGTTTALVGPSGAGKSTVAKLIPRFWDVSEGSITIGGKDIRAFDTETLMRTVSFVFQDTFLFNDTIGNNIKIANSSASNDDMVSAAKAAQIHNFIMTLPDGYETMAGDRGTNLSGGQKQRITIARAILRDSPIIVLDEATAFADPENEEEIIKALSNLMKNKTVIVIAHRLSTIKDVQQIVVFDKGEVSEVGKHEELLNNEGIYHTLWQNYEKAQSWDLHCKGDSSDAK